MALQQKIPILPSPAIASYSYTDIDSGTGYVIYYGSKDYTESSGNFDYSLSNNVHYSQIIEEEVGISGASPTLKWDIDYDLSAFNTSKVVEGKAIFEAPILSKTTVEWTGYIKFILRKVDGTTSAETDLATAIVGDPSSGTGSNQLVPLAVGSCDVPKTKFKVGDILRVTFQMYAYATPSPSEGWIAHDPAGRQGGTRFTTQITTFRAHIPYRLNL